MTELSEAQLEHLRQLEHDAYVRRVRDEILAKYPDLASDAGLLRRLIEAHRHALALGLTDGGQRTQFLYTEAFAPGFYQIPTVHAWLTRPGRPIAQQWRDLMAVRKHLIGRH
jgi:hypothetical protein